MSTKFINLTDPESFWDLTIVADIIGKVNEYALQSGYTDAKLVEIEDGTASDTVNKRYDVTICFSAEGHTVRQKLLYLKGEIVDGDEFHRRFREFYPERRAV